MLYPLVHIAYGETAAECLSTSIDQYNLPGDRIVTHLDDFTQGPIYGVRKRDNLSIRGDYWKEVGERLHFDFDVRDRYWSSITQLEAIPEPADVVLWVGQSAHDILATSWTISYFQMRRWRLYSINLPDLNVGAKLPEQLESLYDQRILLKPSEKMKYAQLWDALEGDNNAYRVLSSGEIRSMATDTVDELILNHISDEFSSFEDILSVVDNTFAYELSPISMALTIRRMINSGIVAYDGELKDYEQWKLKSSL